MTKNSTSSLKNRLSSLRKQLKEEHVEGCLIEQPIDLFYLTGLSLSVGKLFVSQKQAKLFVDGRYLQAAKERSPVPVALFSASEEQAFLKQHKIKALGFDSAQTSYDGYLKLKRLKVKLVPFPNLLKQIRALKDAHELNDLRLSAQLLWKGFRHITTCIKPGVTEKEVALSFEIFCRSGGATGMAFEPIIAFGANSAMPHHRASDTRFKASDVVLIDIGVVVNRYNSDMTRMILPKRPSDALKKTDAIVHEAKLAALDLCRPGIPLKALDLAAREVMRRAGVEEHFIHSLGHGVGLEIHEYPRIKYDGADRDVILEKGMVITIEPGLYFPGEFGVRHEDTITITKDGYENFYPERLP